MHFREQYELASKLVIVASGRMMLEMGIREQFE